ncbi:hypothetical protein AAHB54_14815 [Bacillus cereus]
MDFEKIHRDFNVDEKNIYIHSFMCGAVNYKEKTTDLSEELIITQQENHDNNQLLLRNSEVEGEIRSLIIHCLMVKNPFSIFTKLIHLVRHTIQLII